MATSNLPDNSEPRQVEQVETEIVAVEKLMTPADFNRGVAEVRAGTPPNFDIPEREIADAWAYERGRQFGLIAPAGMPLRVGGRINRKAVALFEAAERRGWITP
jgi:hypothetical protein